MKKLLILLFCLPILLFAQSPTVTILNSNPDTICGCNTVIISGATTNDSISIWTTSGDGIFSWPLQNTTTYNPGPSDCMAGSVNLTLTAYGYSPSNNASSTMTLLITPGLISHAGQDDTTCCGTSYQVSGTASNNTGVNWTTSGDGFFNNPAANFPTYYPGPIDDANGGVTLILTAYGNYPCDSVVDSMLLTLVCHPTANANVDDTICAGNNYIVMGSATNYNYIVWSTNGDGYFNNQVLITTYNPGPNDTISGSVTLTLTAYGNYPCDPVSDSMVLTIIPCVSTTLEELNIDKFLVYPNPSKDVFNIEFSSLAKQDLEVRIINSIGEIVYRDNVKNHIGEYRNSISLEEYSKSIYFLEIQTDDGIVDKKLILQ